MHTRTLLTAVLVMTMTCVATHSFAADKKGQGIYMNFCSSCHASGIAGAPKVGDKDDWASRVEQGMDVMIEHAIKGYQGKSGYMPAKGGHSALTDEEVAAAVNYMVEQSR